MKIIKIQSLRKNKKSKKQFIKMKIKTYKMKRKFNKMIIKVINSRRKIHCKIKRSYYQKKIKARNLNLFKRKLKLNQRNQNQHLRMFLMIYKALNLNFIQVLKNK